MQILKSLAIRRGQAWLKEPSCLCSGKAHRDCSAMLGCVSVVWSWITPHSLHATLHIDSSAQKQSSALLLEPTLIQDAVRTDQQNLGEWGNDWSQIAQSSHVSLAFRPCSAQPAAPGHKFPSNRQKDALDASNPGNPTQKSNSSPVLWAMDIRIMG